MNWRAAKRVAFGGLGVVAVWLLVHRWPQPFFPHTLRAGPIAIHARAPIPPQAAGMLAEVNRRLARSPLYREDRVHDVFLCDTPAVYAFFAPHRPRSGGETFFWLGNSVFLRPADLEADRLIGPSGSAVPAPRTLTYFLTHELTHAMTVDALGLWAYVRLERWQDDGYADYVAKAGAFDAEATRRAFLAGAPELDPAQSGLYLRYHLLVAQVLDGQHRSVGELLAGPLPAGPVEAQLRAASAPDGGRP